jgi:probable HAF family extracellular repeat protein
MNRYLFSLVALGLLQCVTGQVKAQPTYAFTKLDVPGSSFLSGYASASGINASGQIVGYYGGAGNSHGFLFDSGTYTTLTHPARRIPRPTGSTTPARSWDGT